MQRHGQLVPTAIKVDPIYLYASTCHHRKNWRHESFHFAFDVKASRASPKVSQGNRCNYCYTVDVRNLPSECGICFGELYLGLEESAVRIPEVLRRRRSSSLRSKHTPVSFKRFTNTRFHSNPIRDILNTRLMEDVLHLSAPKFPRSS